MITEAMKHIEGNSAAFTDKVKETETPIAAIPNNVNIESLEKYMPGRSRLRGSYKVSNLEHFITYTNKAAENEEAHITQCFVDVDAMNATAFFNIGDTKTPGHCDRTALLTLLKTADYKALLDIVDQPLNQKRTAEFVEDWESYITVLDANGENIPTNKAVAAIRNITIEAKASTDSSVGSFNAKKTALEEVEARAKDVQPAFFQFTCIPYNGLQERTFNMRLSITTDGTPMLTLRLIRHESTIEEMGEELLAKLNDNLDREAISTYIGSFTP